MVSVAGRDRAQLILLGCLALAFVVISVGLLINTTIHTESSSQALSNAQVDSATALDLETRRGTRSLIHRVNLGPRDRDKDDVQANVTDTVNNYSVLLGEQYARSRAATVAVDYSEAGSSLGARAVQEGDGSFDDSVELDGSVNQRIGWFVVNTNVSRTDTQDNPFELIVENESGDELTIEIYENESVSGSEPHLTIDTDLGAGTTARNVTCNPRRNRVVLDAVTGRYIADDCSGPSSLHGINDLDPPHTDVRAPPNHRFNGTWEFVTNDTSGVTGIDDCHSSDLDANEACSTYAVWTANVTTAFDSDGATFHRNRNVTIYGGDR